MTPAQVKGKEQGLPAEGPASVVQEEGAGVREVQERLGRIEEVLEAMAENIAKLK